MQLRRKLAFAVGGSILLAWGVLTACSTGSNSKSSPLPTTPPKPSPDGSNIDPEQDAGPGDPDASSADSGPDCSGAPRLWDGGSKGVFCFGGAGSSDGGQCPESTVCCSDERNADGGFEPSSCVAATVDPAGGFAAGACTFAPDAGGREWHCTESSHCPGEDESCCVTAGATGTPQAQADTKFPGCGTFFNSGNPAFVGGSRCRKNGCSTGELTLCNTDAECGEKKCRPIKIASRNTGVCM